MAWDFETDPEFQEQLGRSRSVGCGPAIWGRSSAAKAMARSSWRPSNDLLPAYHLPKRREAAQEKYAELLEPIDDEF